MLWDFTVRIQFPPGVCILLMDFDRSHVVSTLAIQAAQALYPFSPTTVLSTGIRSSGRRQVKLHAMIPSGDNRKEWTPTTLWKSHEKAKVPDDTDTRRITCLLPLELTHMILGFSMLFQTSLLHYSLPMAML